MQPITAGTALAASFTIASGRLFSLVMQFDPALGSGTYYLAVIPGISTIPDNGTDIGPLRPIQTMIWVHTTGETAPISIEWDDYGPPLETGAAGSTFLVCASSTVLSSFTSIGAHLWKCGGSAS